MRKNYIQHTFMRSHLKGDRETFKIIFPEFKDIQHKENATF